MFVALANAIDIDADDNHGCARQEQNEWPAMWGGRCHGKADGRRSTEWCEAPTARVWGVEVRRAQGQLEPPRLGFDLLWGGWRIPRSRSMLLRLRCNLLRSQSKVLRPHFKLLRCHCKLPAATPSSSGGTPRSGGVAANSSGLTPSSRQRSKSSRQTLKVSRLRVKSSRQRFESHGRE